jgi:hypothetical protein
VLYINERTIEEFRDDINVFLQGRRIMNAIKVTENKEEYFENNAPNRKAEADTRDVRHKER